MKAYWTSLAELPAQGAHCVIEDAAVWDSLVEEFRLDCRLPQSPQAALHIVPVDGGVLVRGRLTGVLALPCSRCAEETPVPLEERFEHFIALPSEEEVESEKQEYEQEAHLRILAGGVPELDLAGLCGEEFVLALPAKVLCAPDCKGLCPECGTNSNEASCDCADETDLRLAVLRGLKIPS